MPRSLLLFIMAFALALAACSRQDETDKNANVTAGGSLDTAAIEEKTNSRFTAANVTRGAGVFQQRCAECHGPEAQGHPDWQPDKKRKMIVAPPLNGNGPAHRRSPEQLTAAIKNGVRRGNIAAMPGWEGRVSEQEIKDVIVWMQAMWPPEVYDHWSRRFIKKSATAKASK